MTVDGDKIAITIVTCLRNKKKAKSFCSSAKIGKIQRLKKARLRERWKIVTTGNQANFFIEDVRCRSDLRSNDSSTNTNCLTSTTTCITLDEPHLGPSLEYPCSTELLLAVWKFLRNSKGSSKLESNIFCFTWLYSFMLLGRMFFQLRTNRS